MPPYRRHPAIPPQVAKAEPGDSREYVEELFREYLTWANSRASSEFGVSFNINNVLNQDLNKLNQFMPPEGCLLLGKYEMRIACCVGLRKIDDETGEIKRMYVRPEYQRKGIGQRLLEALIEEARCIGYSKIRLDSAPFAREAQAFYRKMGFRDIDPYPESEAPREYYHQWTFMEIWL